ncbi:MAG: M48 family metalloprotease [Pseudomonadota bacterium]
MRFFVTLLVAALAVSPLRASDLPDLGESARATVSEAEEAKVGRAVMRQIRGDRDYLDDPEVVEYLSRLGEALVAASPAPHRTFEFFAVRDDSLNAFALPGGFIGVHTGLIAAARSESELAGVLAHEIAHVTQNHIARIVDAQRGSALSSLAALAIAILAARADQGQLAQAAMVTAQAATLQSQLDYTRAHEREADRIGLQTLLGSGFDPTGMATFFERLQAHGRVYESPAPAYLRTHPLTFERMADLQNRLAELPYRQHPDSLEFRLIRAKLQASAGEAGQAYARFKTLVSGQDDVALRYGLAVAALRAGERDQAASLAKALRAELDVPLVWALAIRTERESGRLAHALALAGDAVARHAGDKPLAYLRARVLIESGQAQAALAFIEERQRWWPGDATLHRLRAESHLALGHRSESHLAQAEAYLLLDLPAQAMDQLQQARLAADGGFYTQSKVDARLRELRERESRERDDREKRRPGNSVRSDSLFVA